MRGSEFAELRIFTEVAGRRSFSKAAEHLGIAPSTVSQTVRALEDRLGVSLLARTTRRVSVTSAGALLLQRLKPAIEEMRAAVLETRDGRVRPVGTVRLHAPRPAYVTHIQPRLAFLRDKMPDVVLDLTVEDAPTDQDPGAYDLVIRRAAFVEGLTALDLGHALRHAVVASPRYIAERGRPRLPEDLSSHRCIRWRPAGSETQRWLFEAEGDAVTVEVEGPLVVSHCEAATAAALQGVGIAYVLESYTKQYVDDGRLVPLLTEYLPLFGGWKLCYPAQVRLTAAAIAVADLLTAADGS